MLIRLAGKGEVMNIGAPLSAFQDYDLPALQRPKRADVPGANRIWNVMKFESCREQTVWWRK
jgi:hypothetical protein